MRKALTILALLGLSLPAAAEIYQWVDANGHVQYSDRPREGATLVPVASSPTDPAKVRERELRRWEAVTSAERGEQEAREELAARADADADLEAQRKENCSKARRRYAQYSQAHRIYQDLPNGERRYLTDAETTEAREGAAAAVEEWCGEAP
jgi:hypothetical protein